MKRQNVKTGRFLKVAVWVRTWQKEWQKSASGNSKSSMLMLSKIIRKLWSLIFFRINICVFKGLFKHGSAGAPHFLSQKKSTQPKLLTFQQRLVLMVAMMRRPRWLRMGRSLQPIGWLEGSDLEPQLFKEIVYCSNPFEELWSQHFRLLSTFVKEKLRVGFTSKWTSKVAFLQD